MNYLYNPDWTPEQNAAVQKAQEITEAITTATGKAASYDTGGTRVWITPTLPMEVQAGKETDAEYLKEQMHQKYAEQQRIQPPPATAPPAPMPCSKGNKYLASTWEGFFGCPDGYTRPLFSDYCECQQGTQPQAAGIGNLFGLGNLDTGTKKYIPYLILGAIALFIFGGKK